MMMKRIYAFALSMVVLMVSACSDGQYIAPEQESLPFPEMTETGVNVFDVLTDIYTNYELERIREWLDDSVISVEELNYRYPIQFIDTETDEYSYESYYTICYRSKSKILILYYTFDYPGHTDYLPWESSIIKLSLPKQYFEKLTVGESTVLNVLRLDFDIYPYGWHEECGEYPFIYAFYAWHWVPVNFFSYHYTVDGYVVEIVYEGSWEKFPDNKIADIKISEFVSCGN